jgi:hypothetical protein
MVSKAKLYSQLDRLESELRERLIPHVERAARGENDQVFCVADFNPFPGRRFTTDPETEALVVLGRQILSMRNKLGESSDGVIAEKICRYCRKWADVADSHGSAVTGLAKELLEEVRSADA